MLHEPPFSPHLASQSPFLFAVHHLDFYPSGKPDMSVDSSLAGRAIGEVGQDAAKPQYRVVVSDTARGLAWCRSRNDPAIVGCLHGAGSIGDHQDTKLIHCLSVSIGDHQEQCHLAKWHSAAHVLRQVVKTIRGGCRT